VPALTFVTTRVRLKKRYDAFCNFERTFSSMSSADTTDTTLGTHRDNFERIQRRYVVADPSRSLFLTDRQIRRLAPDFLGVLSRVMERTAPVGFTSTNSPAPSNNFTGLAPAFTA
jgi:hypothetical protein